MSLYISTGGVLLVILCLPGLVPAHTTSLKLRGDGSTKNWVYVNFYGETFLEFHTCLTSPSSLTCSAAVTRDSKTPAKTSELRVVSTHKTRDQEPNRAYSRFFSCALSQDLRQVLCRRLPVFSPCSPDHAPFQDVQLDRGGQCVGLVWGVVGEQLVNGSLDIHVCPLTCDRDDPQGSLDSEEREDEHRRDSSEQHHDNNDKPGAWHDDHDDNLHWGHPRRHDNEFADTKSHIIIAVVCSIGLTAALLIAAGLFHRKYARKTTPPEVKEEMKMPARQPSKISSSSKNNKANNLQKVSVVPDPSRLNSSNYDVALDGLPF